MKELSKRAQEVLAYIVERIEDGMPPSVREICKDLHFKSTSTAHKYLQELHDTGYIVKGDGLNRSIRLPNNRKGGIPLVGLVTAGQPITAEEHIEDYIPMQMNGFSSKDLFALRVRGESMINAGIMDGDIVIVARTPVARNGQIVVAMMDNEATVKTFYKENGSFRLQPENDELEPIYSDDVSVCGVVVRSIRDY